MLGDRTGVSWWDPVAGKVIPNSFLMMTGVATYAYHPSHASSNTPWQQLTRGPLILPALETMFAGGGRVLQHSTRWREDFGNRIAGDLKANGQCGLPPAHS